jgi:hypothetical protein
LVALGHDSHAQILPLPGEGAWNIFAGSAAKAEDKCHDIENKVMFVSSRRSDLLQALPLGRGGGGKGVFTCSLLDWGAGKRCRRNVHDQCVDQAQEAAVAPHAALTQQRMEGFLQHLAPPLQVKLLLPMALILWLGLDWVGDKATETNMTANDPSNNRN